MGLIQAYAIYRFGRERGKEEYRRATQYAEIQARESERRLAAERASVAICSICNHRYEQHSDRGACPVYDE